MQKKTILNYISNPKLDTPAKQQLKQQLIENSEKIINLCHNSTLQGGADASGADTGTITRGDICQMELDMDSLEEKVVGLSDLTLTLSSEERETYEKEAINHKPTDPLPPELIQQLSEVGGGELEKLEKERDEIVRELYGG